MLLADYRNHLDPPFLENLCDLNRHHIAARGGHQQSAISGICLKVSQDAFGKTRHIFKKHGLALPVGTHHLMMVGQRKLHNGMKAGKRAITGPHFLNHDPAVPRAKQMHHSAREYGLSEPLGHFFNKKLLRSDFIDQATSPIQISHGSGKRHQR